MSRKAKVPPGLSRRNNSEAGVANNLLNGYVVKGSRGETLVREFMFGAPIDKISRSSLLALTQVISNLIDVNFPRNYTRKKDLIIKWFEQYEKEIREKKEYISIIFKEQSSGEDDKEKGEEDKNVQEETNSNI